MAVVPLDAVYVVANYKETQLTHVRAGQPVEIDGRFLPGHRPARAISTASSPASGLEFALLPADNATGNFTKIVQRVPVKIVLDDKALARPLAPRHVGRGDYRHQGEELTAGMRPMTPVVPLKTWIAIVGSIDRHVYGGASTFRSSTPRWPTSRVRSAPASTTAPGSRPPTWWPRSSPSRSPPGSPGFSRLRRYLITNVVLFLVFSVACAWRTQSRADDRAARPAGLLRRCDDPDVLHPHHHAATAGQAAGRDVASSRWPPRWRPRSARRSAAGSPRPGAGRRSSMSTWCRAR